MAVESIEGIIEDVGTSNLKYSEKTKVPTEFEYSKNIATKKFPLCKGKKKTKKDTINSENQKACGRSKKKETKGFGDDCLGPKDVRKKRKFENKFTKESLLKAKRCKMSNLFQNPSFAISDRQPHQGNCIASKIIVSNDEYTPKELRMAKEKLRSLVRSVNENRIDHLDAILLDCKIEDNIKRFVVCNLTSLKLNKKKMMEAQFPSICRCDYMLSLIKALNTLILFYGTINQSPLRWLNCILDVYYDQLVLNENCRNELFSIYSSLRGFVYVSSEVTTKLDKLVGRSLLNVPDEMIDRILSFASYEEQMFQVGFVCQDLFRISSKKSKGVVKLKDDPAYLLNKDRNLKPPYNNQSSVINVLRTKEITDAIDVLVVSKDPITATNSDKLSTHRDYDKSCTSGTSYIVDPFPEQKLTLVYQRIPGNRETVANILRSLGSIKTLLYLPDIPRCDIHEIPRSMRSDKLQYLELSIWPAQLQPNEMTDKEQQDFVNLWKKFTEEKFKELQHIRIRGSIEEFDLKGLIIPCRNLKSLDIPINLQISGDVVSTLGRNCPNLSSLNLHARPKTKLTNSFVKKWMSNLRSITNLRIGRIANSFGIQVMSSIARNGRQLQTLQLETSERIINSGIELALLKCKKLQKIKLYSRAVMSNDQYRHFTSQNSHIEFKVKILNI